MSRLPIRIRVTAAFALAMAAVLGLTALFLYLRLGSHLSTAKHQPAPTAASRNEAPPMNQPRVVELRDATKGRANLLVSHTRNVDRRG